MKLGPVTKSDKRNKKTSKKLMLTSSQKIVMLLLFLIYDQFGAILKSESRRIVCKTYILINSNLSSHKN